MCSQPEVPERGGFGVEDCLKGVSGGQGKRELTYLLRCNFRNLLIGSNCSVGPEVTNGGERGERAREIERERERAEDNTRG